MTKTGRPTKLTTETRREVCERLASGESLRGICRDEHIPAISTVLLWVVEDRDGFSEQYMIAREAAGFAHAERITDLVEKLVKGEVDHQTARVAIDGLRWAAERMAPKQHSPRQEVTGESGKPIKTETSVDASNLSDQALDELMASKGNGSESQTD